MLLPKHAGELSVLIGQPEEAILQLGHFLLELRVWQDLMADGGMVVFHVLLGIFVIFHLVVPDLGHLIQCQQHTSVAHGLGESVSSFHKPGDASVLPGSPAPSSAAGRPLVVIILPQLARLWVAGIAAPPAGSSLLSS